MGKSNALPKGCTNKITAQWSFARLAVTMMTVTQTTRLLAWLIVGLIVLGIVLYLFGPAALRTDELIIIGLLIIGLIWFHVWLRRRAE
jgi:hypothetical protein